MAVPLPPSLPHKNKGDKVTKFLSIFNYRPICLSLCALFFFSVFFVGSDFFSFRALTWNFVTNHATKIGRKYLFSFNFDGLNVLFVVTFAPSSSLWVGVKVDWIFLPSFELFELQFLDLHCKYRNKRSWYNYWRTLTTVVRLRSIFEMQLSSTKRASQH